MLKLYDDNHNIIATLTEFSDLKIESTLCDGKKVMTFVINKSAPFARMIQNEYYIHTTSDEYVIKEVEQKDRDHINVSAALNLEALENMIYDSFKTTEKLISECITSAILFRGGWTVGDCEITKRRTIMLAEPCTALNIISQCISTYNCEIKYDTLQKRINIYEHIGSDKGAYFIESLNLRKCNYKHTSYDFYTRIFPRGKDGLRINVDGKEYIDNTSYSSKIKSFIWKDERYTIPENLAEDAAIKLAEMAKPVRSYTADVIDLAKQSSNYRGILDYELGDTVYLISNNASIREKMRIVKTKEYPLSPEKNSVELSNGKKSFKDVQEKFITEIAKQLISAETNEISETTAQEGEST